MICVIDYGMGNLRSVSKAVEKLGGVVSLSSCPEDLEKAEKLILPGVGAFGNGCGELQKRGLFEPLLREIRKNKPFLGICLGMQLLFENSEESPEAKGLGFFSGSVQRFKTPGLKVPHMGWNEMKIKSPQPPVLSGLKPREYFYFVHSYYAVPEDDSLIKGTCEYGGREFAAFVGRDRVWASQFHPEKSQEAGLRILSNFLAL